MKTPLPESKMIPALLQEHWNLTVTGISFIPIGDSAYSYRVETQPRGTYYLKVVDQRTAAGQGIAQHMEFSLPFQRLVARQQFVAIAAPLPQTTIYGALYALHGPLLLALYTFIQGDTLAGAYPFSLTLIEQIGRALATLHTIQLPDALRRRSPQDSLDAPFDENLLADLDSLTRITAQDAPYLQRLRELVWPRRAEIRAFLARSQEYAKRARQTEVARVACHGDPWGGNIIPTPAGQLVFLDWEAAVVAPPERDAFIYMGYIGADFAAFERGYNSVRQEPTHWHAAWLAYYAYRMQLRNLAHWLHNLLHEPLDEAQRENDVTMIEQHCLDRLGNVGQAATKLLASLDA